MNPPSPFDLRCEYLQDPLGIDVPSPRLSWVLDHPERGQQQSAYRIIVSSSLELASKENGDLWDSGKVTSPSTILVPYAGTPLHSSKSCFWRVQWWDGLDRSSPFSDVAAFELGLLHRSDWKGTWISKKVCREFTSKGTVLLGEFLGDYVNCYGIYLRKSFKLTGPVESARAYVCGLGYYELRINGSRIGDRVLDPAQTDYKKVSLYSTYDITSALRMRSPGSEDGAFAVGAILGNGRHIKNYGYAHPKVIVQIFLKYAGGTSQTFVSDGTWRTSHGPLQQNGLYFGERYDARLEMPGWDQPDYDDTAWEPAAEVGGYPLSSQLIPPIRVVETRAPKILATTHGLTFVYDCGQNLTGWIRVTVRGVRGTEIRVRHSELLNEDGTLNVSPNQNAEATDVYVLCGDGTESYEPKFTYHGFRYFEISGHPSMPEIISVEACFVHSDVGSVGTFRCSSELLNRVHQNILMGQRANLMSIPTDCTQRDERHGWLGDAHLVAEQAMFNFDMAQFYLKYLDDIRHAQKEDGSLPDVVPPYTGRLYPADPAWSSAYITITWYVYLMYGDTKVLQNHYDCMKKYVAYLRTQADGNIVRKLGKYGDWCPPGSIAPKRTPVELTATWFYYHDTLLLSRIARALKYEADVRELTGLAQEILSAFNREYLGEKEYKGNKFAPEDRSPSQTSNALPLYLRMAPVDKEHQVFDRLVHSVVEEQDYHLDTGILGTRYLLDVLTDLGRVDVAYKVASQRTYPGWGYMVDEGATTLWERWEKITGGGMNSHNHIMLGSVDAWLYRVLAGISCHEPGWSNIVIKPHIIEGLTFAEAEVKTVKGFARVSWQRSGRVMNLNFTIPVGCVGQVFVPIIGEEMSIEEKGIVIWEDGITQKAIGSDIRFKENDGRHIHFEHGSGAYEMKIRATETSSL